MPCLCCVGPCSLTTPSYKGERQISLSCRPALCTVDEDPQREERDKSFLELEQHPGSWTAVLSSLLHPSNMGKGFQSFQQYPLPHGVRDGRCVRCTIPKLSWVFLSLFESGTQNTEGLTKQCLQTLFLPHQAPPCWDPEPTHRCALAGQRGCSPASPGVSSLPCFMHCAILERNQPSLLNLPLFQNTAGVKYETGCDWPDHKVLRPIPAGRTWKEDTLLHNQTPAPRPPSCSLD